MLQTLAIRPRGDRLTPNLSQRHNGPAVQGITETWDEAVTGAADLRAEGHITSFILSIHRPGIILRAAKMTGTERGGVVSRLRMAEPSQSPVTRLLICGTARPGDRNLCDESS